MSYFFAYTVNPYIKLIKLISLHALCSFRLPFPPPIWKFQLSLIHFFIFFGLLEPLAPREFQFLLKWGGVWIFSGTTSLGIHCESILVYAPSLCMHCESSLVYEPSHCMRCKSILVCEASLCVRCGPMPLGK